MALQVFKFIYTELLLMNCTNNVSKALLFWRKSARVNISDTDIIVEVTSNVSDTAVSVITVNEVSKKVIY